MAEEKQRGLGVSGTQAIGSALGAVTAAVVLSTLGVAGTLIGAAVSSLVWTFGGAIYTRYAEAGRKRVRQAAEVAKDRVEKARTRSQDLPAGMADDVAADDELAEAQEALEEVEQTETERTPWRELLRGLPWKRITLVSVGVFIVAMAIIVTFELVAGRSVSSFTGGAGTDGPRTSLSFGQGSSTGGGGDSNQPDGDGSTPDQDNDRDNRNQFDTPRPTPTTEPSSQTPEPTVEPTRAPTSQPEPNQEAPEESSP